MNRMEKDYHMALLLDFYGELLPQRQREAMEYYYGEDMSLSEIGEAFGISRQGVHDRIVKGSRSLADYEEKLGLVGRFIAMKEDVERLTQKALSLCEGRPEDAAEIHEIAGRLLRQL